MTELRKTFLKVVEMVGAEPNESTITYYRLDNNNHISIYQNTDRRHNNVCLSFVKNGKVLINETIKEGASNKVIQNRINKIMATYKA